MKPSGWNSSYCAGASAYAAIVAALISRNRDAGYGQEIDIAATDVMASTFCTRSSSCPKSRSHSSGPATRTATTGPVPVADGHFAPHHQPRPLLARGHEPARSSGPR
ncbi:MAG: hypothetical protein H6676_00975 [Thermoflexaceae bacterium]|nr:hypothetical protein [Thermoflexaceae bacterium]